MGLLGLLSTALSGVSDGIKSLMADAKKHLDQSVLDGIMAGLAMVVMADGKAEESEIAQASEQVKMHPILSTYSESDTTLKLMEYVRQLTASPTMTKLTLKGKIEKLKTKPDQARILVAMMCDVAAADDNFDEKEKSIVREVCNLLSIPASEFGL